MKKTTEDGEVITLATPFETVPKDAPFFKTPWNHDTNAESDAVALTCNDPSKTQQQFLKDADINVILAKFLKTGELTGQPGDPQFADIEEGDLQDRMVTSYEVDQAWNALPAAVRNILKDPKNFTDYVHHCLAVGDLDPLIELGLATAKAPPEPTPKTPPAANQEPPKPPTPPVASPDTGPAAKAPPGP